MRPIDADALIDQMESDAESMEMLSFKFATYAAINDIKHAPTISQPITMKWIPCSERLPDCEQEVLICTEEKLIGHNPYIDSIVTPAIYEDGTMPECDSKWSWIDMDFDEWDEENDCGIIPEGWWENRHFNRDEEYNNPVDRKVVAWMPLPAPYREE